MKIMRRLSLIMVLVSLLALLFTWLNPHPVKADVAFDFEGEKHVIIGFHDGFSPQDLALELDINQEFGLINAVSTTLNAEAISHIQQHAAIRYIDVDQPVEISAPPFSNTQEETPSWGLERIFESDTYPFDYWTETDGTGVKVAVFDTGIDGAHEDLHVAGGYNTISDDPYDVDLNGHGTHVAGIIAGLYNDVGIVGVAPSVELYSLVVLDDDGNGSSINLIEAIEWVVDNNIPIVNMSIGMSESSTALENAINEAHALGHIFIGAAGNDGESGGSDNMAYPAKYANVIAVGATDDDDTRASYSSYGPALDIMAPGTSIRSTFPDNQYGYNSGTSMAAPFVSGVIALMLQKNSSLSHDDILSLLTNHAEDLGLSSNEQGAGLLRGDWALDATMTSNDETMYTISVVAGDHGDISPGGTFEAEAGSDITFTLSPDEGYRVFDVLINGDSLGSVETFTLLNIDQNYDIEVSFTKATYTLSFETFDGEPIDAIDLLYQETIPTLPSGSLEGHTFKGWYFEDTFDTIFDLETMPAYDITIYAWFEINTYTISFDTSSAENIESLDVVYNDIIPSLPVPTLEGHSFDGWYFDADYENIFNLETMPAKDFTLYASFERNTYTITFETTTDETISSIDILFEETIPALPSLTKTGHTFIGWYLETTFETPFDLEMMPAKDLTLYAHFEVNSYSLKIYQDATLIYDQEIAYATPLETLDLPTPNKEGFSFIGYDPPLPTHMPAYALELQASFERNSYLLTIEMNDDDLIEETLLYQEDISYPEPLFKQGYDFLGWQTEDTLIESDKMPSNDLFLTPLYEERDVPSMPDLENEENFEFGERVEIIPIDDGITLLNDEIIESPVEISRPGTYRLVLDDGHYEVVYEFNIASKAYSELFDMTVFISALGILGLILFNPLKRLFI